ncbi:MAG TPA: hypothetical protein VGG39_02920 [Polyangiaceae bacterium]
MTRGFATPWDTRLFARAAAAAVVALALAWLVTTATDEGGVAWGERAGRTLPLAPLCAAVGAWAALAPVRARGEVVALEALGRSTAQIAAAAVCGAAAVAVLAAAAIAGLHAVDVAGFFPTATHASRWAWVDGAFVDAAHGIRVGADGAAVTVAVAVDRAPSGIPRFGRASAAVVTALAGLALPLLLGRTLLDRARAWPVVAASAAAIAASVLAFQASAAERLPALAAVLPAAALLAFAVRRYRA